MVRVGEVDVVQQHVGKLDLAQDPPEPHNKGVARPEGSGGVPWGVGIG